MRMQVMWMNNNDGMMVAAGVFCAVACGLRANDQVMTTTHT
jgi:hypothetical protein